MEPATFHGEAFSEYYCTRLIWSAPQLGKEIDQDAAADLFNKASSTIRFAQRQLRDRDLARSTYSLLLERLAGLLGWRLGQPKKVVTEFEQEEEGGMPLLDGEERRHEPGGYYLRRTRIAGSSGKAAEPHVQGADTYINS